jgi:hypothetical protein
MFNANLPPREELPSTERLLKSTALAAAAATAILLTVVLPAEYGVDPTGLGRVTGLTQMGEIKKQLAIEAEADRQRDGRRSSLLGAIVQLAIPSAAAQTTTTTTTGAVAERSDETVVTLKPNEGVEYKMTMVRGAKAQFSWRVEGGNVNYDLHGTPKGGGKETSYKKASGVDGDQGTVTADYDGSHGWFWRNRGTKDVTITLKTNGAYSEIKQIK